VRQGEVSNALVAGMDVFPTIMALAGVSALPTQKMDGFDFSAVLLDSQAESVRTNFVYYALEGTADAVRMGKYKVHFRTSVWLDVDQKQYHKVGSCHPEGIQVGCLVFFSRKFII
jgi:arylsulfatase A-like enzyme